MNKNIVIYLTIIVIVVGLGLFLKYATPNNVHYSVPAITTTGGLRLLSAVIATSFIIYEMLTHLGMNKELTIRISPLLAMLLLIYLLSRPAIIPIGTPVENQTSTNQIIECDVQRITYCYAHTNATACNITECPKCDKERSCDEVRNKDTL